MYSPQYLTTTKPHYFGFTTEWGIKHKNFNSPLFDAVPINNYIVSVLHIIIGIGNSLVDVLFDWVEWRIEKLTPAEITVRNSMMYAEVQLVQAKERYENWLDNEGVTLASKLAEKKKLQKELSAKVSFSTAT